MELAERLNGCVTRSDVERLQREVSRLPQYVPDTKHYFHGGMYCREVSRPENIIVVGKVHKKEHFYVIISGKVAITTDAGVQIVEGPHVFSCSPGTKRAVFSITPAVCMTFHKTDATTVEEAEAELIEEDDQALFDASNQLRAPKREELQ